MIFVSSINKSLYDEYGKRMIDGWLKNSKDVQLMIIFEGQIPKELKEINHRLFSVKKLKSKEFDQFQSFFGKLYEANGIRLHEFLHPNGERRIEIKRDFRFDLVRFSFKIFSLLVALEEMPQETPFAWIDADLKCLEPFGEDDLTHFMPNGDQIMSYLGRTKFPTKDDAYSECGFLGFNTKHDQTLNFLGRMRDLYLTGEAFRFKQWHDSWLWDEVRKEFEEKGYKFRNISGKFKELEHPFINCGLGKYFDHLKGPDRKKFGQSFDRDFVRN